MCKSIRALNYFCNLQIHSKAPTISVVMFYLPVKRIAIHRLFFFLSAVILLPRLQSIQINTFSLQHPFKFTNKGKSEKWLPNLANRTFQGARDRAHPAVFLFFLKIPYHLKKQLLVERFWTTPSKCFKKPILVFNNQHVNPLIGNLS